MASNGMTVEEQLAIDLGMDHTNAILSECGRYRYELTRRWDDGPLLEFDMLNPSKADASTNDPTVVRCIGFAKRWGYGAIVIRNLYPLRATNPEALLNYSAEDYEEAQRINREEYLSRDDADCTIAAWGAHAAALEWFAAGHRVERRELFCLGTNAGGSPKHPLYVPSSREPVRWEMTA